MISKKNNITFLKKIKNKVLSLALVTGLMLAPVTVAQAEDYWPAGVDVAAESAIIMDVDTGTILYSKNMNDEHYPASITKVMTALLTLENCDLDETVTFSAEAVYGTEVGSSSIARDVGEEMTVEQTLYGMMLESANECAYALAEHVAGSLSAFVDMMNARAKELGCTNTHFNNSNGLPDEEHYTSAYDMALISAAAYKIPKFAEIVGTKNYTIPPTNKHSDPTPLNNHHCMLHYYKTNKYLYDYCLGGKTGYTVVAGANLVTYARKDGMTLVCVVMKDTTAEQYNDTRSLFDYCFDNFAVYNVADFASISQDDANYTGSLSETGDLIKIDKEGKIILPKTASVMDAKSTVEAYKDETDSSVVGQLKYTYADRSIGYANLIFSNIEAQSYPFDNISEEKGGSGKEYIQVDYGKIGFIAAIIIAVLVFILFIRSRMNDISLKMYRFKSKHPGKPKTNFKVIERRAGKGRKRR